PIYFLRSLRRPPRSTLLPSTTLFRSGQKRNQDRSVGKRDGFSVLKPGVQGDARLFHLLQHFGPLRDDLLRLRRIRGRQKRLKPQDRKSTRLNSSHVKISYAVFCLKKK